MSITITGTQSNSTTSAANASEGGNPGFFNPVDSSFSSIQIGWTVVGHPELGTVTNVVYDPTPQAYAAITTSSGSFNYGTSYSFTGGGGGTDGSGATITGGVTITKI